MRVALVSLRFAPAFGSHLTAFAKAFIALGFKVELVLHRSYTDFAELTNLQATRVHCAGLPAESCEYAVFCNVSPQNSALAVRLKTRGTKILYVYHEPWLSASDYLLKEGFRQGIAGVIAHQLSVSMLKMSDAVLVPSAYGKRVYLQKDARYNGSVSYLPLLFDDEAETVSHTKDKVYVSYIGAICRAHGFDEYVSFMRESFLRGTKHKFLIASKSALPSYVLRDDVIAKNLSNVDTRCGHPMSTDEINSHYKRSICVWNLYRRSTQSGVLPKAYMFGTPVIASRTGAFPEFVNHGCNGRFAAAEYAEIEAALKHIYDEIDMYASNARRTFLDTFFYKANLGKLRQILEACA